MEKATVSELKECSIKELLATLVEEFWSEGDKLLVCTCSLVRVLIG